MHPVLTVALIVVSAVAGAMLGVAIAGPWGSVVGVIPPTAVAAWQAWRYQQMRAIRAWIANREAEEWDRVLRSLGSGDMRLP